MKVKRQNQDALLQMRLDKQTMLSWSRLVQSYNALPGCFKGFFTPFMTNSIPFPYCVFTPAFEGVHVRSSEKLVCKLDQEVAILTRTGKGFEELRYPLERISYAKIRNSLLDSSITINGFTNQGNLATTTILFNSVSNDLFTPILEYIRSVAVGEREGETIQNAEIDKFNKWSELNFKFMNYAKRSLLGREKVIQTILQSEIKIVTFSLFGIKFSKTISPTHAIILSDRELILIREEHLLGGEKFGGAWIYIALEQIESLTLNAKEDGLLALSIELRNHESFESLLQDSARSEIEQLQVRFTELHG